MRRILGAIALLAVSVAFAAPTAAQAQGRAGVYGGVNLADVNGDDAPGSSILVGGLAGGFVSVAVHPVVSLALTSYFSMQGAKDSSDDKLKINNINVAPLFQVTPPVGDMSPVRPVFYLGPELSLNLSCDAAGMDCKDNVKSTAFGLLFGGSLVVQEKFFFGVSYSLGLSSFGDPDDLKHNVIHGYAGISFPIGGGGGM